MGMNCIIIDDDPLSCKVLEKLISKVNDINLIATYNSAVEALPALQNDVADLIFLDIEMPEMSGIELLNTLENQPQIIIVSSKEKYALDAFDLNVTDYLLKPPQFSRFFKAVEKVKKNQAKAKVQKDNTEEIFFRSNSVYVKVRIDDILWVEALENYCHIHTYDDQIVAHLNLKAVEKILPATKFQRVHRSYIININKIAMVDQSSVTIHTKKSNAKISVSRTYRERLLEHIKLI